jgi:Protein of unknown function (DUF3761)/Glucodextranase, domain B
VKVFRWHKGSARDTTRTAAAPGHRCTDRVLLCAVLAGGAIALGGCGETANTASNGEISPAAAVASAAPVALHLNAGNYSLAGSTTTLRGTVAYGAKVTVNGQRALVHGVHWSKALHLHLGQNRVTVEATLKGHRAARKTITVTREKSSTEVEAENRSREPAPEGQPGTAPQPTTTPAPGPGEACTNGTYVNSAGNTVCSPEESPSAPVGATAECADGTYSFSESRSGTCSHHGGVARWL